MASAIRGSDNLCEAGSQRTANGGGSSDSFQARPSLPAAEKAGLGWAGARCGRRVLTQPRLHPQAERLSAQGRGGPEQNPLLQGTYRLQPDGDLRLRGHQPHRHPLRPSGGQHHRWEAAPSLPPPHPHRSSPAAPPSGFRLLCQGKLVPPLPASPVLRDPGLSLSSVDGCERRSGRRKCCSQQSCLWPGVSVHLGSASSSPMGGQLGGGGL